MKQSWFDRVLVKEGENNIRAVLWKYFENYFYVMPKCLRTVEKYIKTGKEQRTKQQAGEFLKTGVMSSDLRFEKMILSPVRQFIRYLIPRLVS